MKKENGIDQLLKTLKAKPKMKVLALTPENIRKAREASKLGASYETISKALHVSIPTVWKAVKKIRPYDKV